MRRTIAVGLMAICLCVTGLVRAGAIGEVVTNPTPAVSATMMLTASDGTCFTWTVSGKVKPAYRGHGANVKLVCQQYATLESGGTAVVFPADACDGGVCGSSTNVDACGNFAFDARICGGSPQLDNSNFCVFVVHVDDSKAPQACSSKPSPTDGPPQDPNGTAPCSGGLCPASP